MDLKSIKELLKIVEKFGKKNVGLWMYCNGEIARAKEKGIEWDEKRCIIPFEHVAFAVHDSKHGYNSYTKNDYIPEITANLYSWRFDKEIIKISKALFDEISETDYSDVFVSDFLNIALPCGYIDLSELENDEQKGIFYTLQHNRISNEEDNFTREYYICLTFVNKKGKFTESIGIPLTEGKTIRSSLEEYFEINKDNEDEDGWIAVETDEDIKLKAHIEELIKVFGIFVFLSQEDNFNKFINDAEEEDNINESDSLTETLDDSSKSVCQNIKPLRDEPRLWYIS